MDGHEDALLIRKPDDDATVTFRYAQHTLVEGRAGDTVTSALLNAGIMATCRSLKFRRHRGPFCLTGDCSTCLVRIDGLPNRKACLTPVTPGMEVIPQNRVLPVGPDPTALVDKLFASGMDHHHFMVRPRIVNKIMQGVARNLAGLGTLPDHPPEHFARNEHHSPDVLVVGAGPAGRRACQTLCDAGLEPLIVDRHPWATADARAAVLPQTGVFGAYPQEGLWAASSSKDDTLHTIAPKHVLLTTGARTSMIPMQANDLPGVISARGLLAMLERCRAKLRDPCVVVGPGPTAQRYAEQLQTTRIDPGQVVEILGTDQVEGIELKDGKVPCTWVALAPEPAPAYELARLGGCAVKFNGAGFAVVRDAAGRCDVVGPWTLWAAGEVCGVDGATAAADGRRVAQSIVQHIQERQP